MDLIPHDDLKPSPTFNFAPMVDFLFLMLSLFATLALSRTALYNSDIQLASLKPTEKDGPVRPAQQMEQIHLGVDASGSYRWITEFQEHSMDSVTAVQEELSRQYQMGALFQDKSKVEILLHIDKNAAWKPIAELIFGVRELGFTAYPVYEPIEIANNAHSL